MTQVGTGMRIVLTLCILELAACSTTVAANGRDELHGDGGGSGGGGAAGAGGRGTGGIRYECIFNARHCTAGIVYEEKAGGSVIPGMSCAHPVFTCPYGCNPDWSRSDPDPTVPICKPPPPGCDDAGHCDSGSPDSGQNEGGHSDSGQSDSGPPDAARE
jgi:hypothetical protein